MDYIYFESSLTSSVSGVFQAVSPRVQVFFVPSKFPRELPLYFRGVSLAPPGGPASFALQLSMKLTLESSVRGRGMTYSGLPPAPVTV